MIENLTVLRGNPSPAYPYDEGESRRSRACSLVEAEPEAVIDQIIAIKPTLLMTWKSLLSWMELMPA